MSRDFVLDIQAAVVTILTVATNTGHERHSALSILLNLSDLKYLTTLAREPSSVYELPYHVRSSAMGTRNSVSSFEAHLRNFGHDGPRVSNAVALQKRE